MSEKTEKKPFWSPCAECGRRTIHEEVCSHIENGSEDYHYASTYMIIKCCGCARKSFRYVYEDFENAYPIDDEEWDIPTKIEIYPKFVENHSELDGIDIAPDIVRNIYNESLLAIQENAAILAGLGLRGTIEAICNERGITGRNLEIRISRLASQGMISQKDAERLHAIRFLGNDAAHDIKRPTKNQINVALKIVEHLISSIYILEEEAKGQLDTPVTDFQDFKKLLTAKLSSYVAGDEFPLAKLLGKDIRRFQSGIASMENLLVCEIQQGTYTKLSIGKVDTFAGSPAPLQHFILC